jgi:hypothetical protein
MPRHSSRDPLTRALNAQPAPFVPVAPAYEGLGPLEFHRMVLYWRKWWARLEAAGTDLLPVEHRAHFELELEIHTEILDSVYPPPAWLGMPHTHLASDVAGCAVVRRGEDLFWLSSSGHGEWIPPNRQVYHDTLAAEKTHQYASFWDTPFDASALERALVRPLHDLDPVPTPGPEQASALLDSGRYDLAEALLARYEDNLPLYTYDASPYDSLLGTFSFSDMMTAMAERPELVHRVLESRLPRPSASLAAAREFGIGIVFVEECLASADIISPRMYREFAFPYTKQALQFYEDQGFRTVLYFSGNLMPLLDDLNALPFTAISFEEDRKNYGIDLAAVRRALPGKVLFGNVDAPFVEKATDDEVMAEVRRQIEVAGREGRYVLSVGSPFTPGTSLERVRFFCESTQRL